MPDIVRTAERGGGEMTGSISDSLNLQKYFI